MRNINQKTKFGQIRLKPLLIVVLAVSINGLLIYSMFSKSDTPNLPRITKIPRTTNTPSPRETLAVFSVAPAEVKAKKDQPFELQINLSTKFPLTGADAVLKYNPNMLKVEKLTSGDQFEVYPRLLNDEETGRIIITGININSLNSTKKNIQSKETAAAKAEFATLTLFPISPGETALSFDFIPEKTNTSTAIRTSDGKNILTQTKNVKIQIQ